ncbi:MAG: Na+/H+ antiporter NhaA [Beijerinckiaceae bacterium]|nr:Na+/H+ antiporter NhaA [Beijerinckiaceae bacterium]
MMARAENLKRFDLAARNGAQAFFQHPAAGGVVLMVAAALALVLDNSPLSWLYDTFLQAPIIIQIGAIRIDKPALLWINDGLMAIFFFLVGLEIKREVLEGKLSTVREASLPVIAAVGGMAVPAAIFAFINWGDARALQGWAIPAATDIAFALGILALLGSRVPPALKVFLLALAIIDDLGAIIIIAVFYTSELSVAVLAIYIFGIAVLTILNRSGVTKAAPYLVVGTFIWVCVLKSGVHATLAGVVIALFVPLRVEKDSGAASPLLAIEHGLAPWVAFLIMPVFAFANAGVALYNMTFESLFGGISLGIAAGLFIGKQIGVFGAVWLAVQLKLTQLPDGIRWVHIYGVSLLAGIGFTMSLFIGTLAYSDADSAAAVRIGVLAGSIASAILGYLVLRLSLASVEAKPDTGPGMPEDVLQPERKASV